MSESLRISITKTKKEWKTIDKQIKLLSTNPSLNDIEKYNSYLNSKISALLNDYEKSPELVKALFPKRNPERKNTISPVWHDRLIKMSKELDVSIPTIIDRIILLPLLIEK